MSKFIFKATGETFESVVVAQHINDVELTVAYFMCHTLGFLPDTAKFHLKDLEVTKLGVVTGDVDFDSSHCSADVGVTNGVVFFTLC